MNVLVTKIKGLHCGSCITTIERIGIENGASKVDINLSTMICKLYYEKLDEENMMKSVNNKGYTIEKLATYNEDEL